MGFSVSQLYFNKDIYKNVGWIVRSTDDGTRMECVHPDVIWSSFFFFLRPGLVLSCALHVDVR